MEYYFEFLDDSTFQLTAKATEFTVSNPVTGTKRKIEREFEYSDTYVLGQEVEHDYFHFVVNKPNYKVNLSDFDDMEMLYFKFHSFEFFVEYLI